MTSVFLPLKENKLV